MTTFDWLVIAWAAASLVGACLPVYEDDLDFMGRLGIAAETAIGLAFILLVAWLVVGALVVVVS